MQTSASKVLHVKKLAFTVRLQLMRCNLIPSIIIMKHTNRQHNKQNRFKFFRAYQSLIQLIYEGSLSTKNNISRAQVHFEGENHI